MYASPVLASPFGTPHPTNPIWRYRPVSVANIISNNMFSYAIGDDMKISRTALWTQSCCIRKHKPRDNNIATKKRSRGGSNAFIQMMKKDGAKRKVAPRVPNFPNIQ